MKVKNHKIAKNSTTAKAREKIIIGILRILDIFDVCLTKFKTTKFCLFKLATDFY
jgi:hypothetical protein